MKKIIFIFVLICCFSCEEETNKKDTSIKEIKIDTISTISKTDEIEKHRIEKIDKKYYHVTIHDFENKRDSIVGFDFLESDDALNSTFNYKPFEKNIYSDSISLFKENIEVVIIKSKFDATKAKLTYDSDSINIIKIDNNDVYGADTIPKTFISKMYLKLSGNYFEIDKEYYRDLYEPNLYLTEVYYYDKEIIITMSGSDGYLGYGVTFFLDNEMHMKRLIYIP